MILAVFLFGAVFIKLALVMLRDGADLQARAISQWMRDVPTDAPRGRILDKCGRVLATTETRYNIYVRPNAVKDKDAVAGLMCAVFGYDYDEVMKKISKHSSEVTIATGATKEQLNAIFDSNLTGIYYSEDNLRYYPYGDFMTQALGFTGFDGNGQTGLEAYYDKYLTGTDGYILTETDLVGKELDGASGYYVPAVSGMDIVTTLDAEIQQIAERAVREAVAKYSPKGVSCIVMDYTDGSIAALAEYPSFDLNNVPRDNLEELFLYSKCKLVSTVFEPGSTFKILTAAAALDRGRVSENDRFYCAGSRLVDGKKIRCWKPKGHGSISFAEGVEQSCNCVFMDSALRLGTEEFYDYLDKFGLNSKTGVDITGETSGLFIKEESVKTVDLARIGFGQAVAVTPIGLLAATSAVMNGGYSVKPHLVSGTYDGKSDKIADAFVPEKGKSVVSESTSELMRRLLTGVVEGGSGKGAYNAGYKIGGKTGTAQKYVNGAIAQGKYVSSFIGFSMEENARYGVFLSVDEPQGYVYYGSLVAAPLVGQIFAGIFAYLNVAPEYTGEEADIVGEKFKLPDFSGMSVAAARRELQKLGLYCEISGDGATVGGQYPYAGTTVDKRNAVLLIS